MGKLQLKRLLNKIGMRNVFIILLVLVFKVTSAQKVEINFILVIDDIIVRTGISPVDIVLLVDGKAIDSNSVRYIPGSLKIDSTLYEKIIQYREKTEIRFYYSRFNERGYVVKKYYVLPNYHDWVKATYTIFKIFNLSVKKYRDVFVGNSSQYVYEMQSDLVSATALRKGHKRQRKIRDK